MSLVPAPLASINWKILLLVGAIGTFGLVVLYSAAGGSVSPWASSQGIKLVVFTGMAIVLSRLPERFWKAAAFPTYAAILLALVLVELLGAVGGGSRRWLDTGFIRLQPSELMKFAIVLAVARFYEMLPTAEIRTFAAIWPPALMIGLPFLLVLTQPDLGTATMILAGGAVVIFLAGVPLRLFIGSAALLAAALPVVWSQMHDYQRKRVLIFLDPEKRSTRGRVITSPSRRSRSAPAVSSARASSTARKAISTICPKAIPTSSSRPWPKNGD